MKKNQLKTKLFPILLAMVLLAACTDNDDNGGSSQSSPVDVGPTYTDKTVDVNRDGKAYGQVALRFYSDMPSVAYISIAEFHKMMTGGEAMKVERQGDLYQLATRNGTATVDVKADYLNSTTYAGFVDLMWMLDPTLAPNTMYDGNKYIKFVKMENVSTFKPAGGVRLDFSKYSIDLHDDGSNVYFPFATLADIYSDCNFHNAAYHDDLVVVSTKLDIYSINTIAPEFAAKPYQRTEVTADMAKFRYQELCFVFDNLYGYPGRTILEQNGMAEKGFDATLDVVQNGKVVKKLLQSTNNMDFAWGRMATQYLINDGGHTDFMAMAGLPENIEGDYVARLMTSAANYPEAYAMYQEWVKKDIERSTTNTQLSSLREQAYGDDMLYKVNSAKTTAVIIINSFMDMDEAAWKKYYASHKTDADWQELMKSYKKDVFVGFLYGLQQAKADGVKNLVLDISVNGGGSCDIVGADVAILRKNRMVQFWSQDALEGNNKIATYYVDSNFDGVFDEKDDTNPKFDCSGMNIGVLCSKVAFSCGHQFPTLMKDYGFPIMGERSGGGTCCIQVMQTADGQNFMISTYRDRSTDKVFANTDAGITPNEGYAFGYDHFYDLDFLTTKLNGFYSK
ncbi:MAG: hypothetical protein J5954_07125 [Prevotella sp.]|nr:hypothetical protein [Prevotella sp.]